MKDIEYIDIKNFLPHRAPMLMVDSMFNVCLESVEAEFKIKEDCIFLREDAHLSEAGLIENAAQTCSAIVGRSYFDKNDLEGKGNRLVGFISAIKSAQIHKLPNVGQLINTKANLVSRFDTESYSICTIRCTIENEAELLAECEMNLFIQEA